MNGKIVLIGFIQAVFLISGTGCSRNHEVISVDSVQTENGLISGVYGKDPQVKIFLGVPFAAPPAGDLRWKEPQPVEDWQGIRKCNTFGPNAMQNDPVPYMVYTEEFLIPKAAVDEDCLYLNIWTAANITSEKRPVIVFIHGGGFVSGSGSVPIYDGEAMAKKEVVFVTTNYRLGIFGFFAHPELTDESPHKTSGNYGIMDQIAALRWVRDNIAFFGGDPDNITIAGQSAGSISVNTLSASPLAAGLFHKVIAESGASVIRGRFGGTEHLLSAEARGTSLAETLGSVTLEELRGIPAAELQKAVRGINRAIVDGYVLTEPIPDIFAGGKQADVPLLTGWNGDDVLGSPSVSLNDFLENLKSEYGDEAGKIMEFYPAATDLEAVDAQRFLNRDISFGIQNYAWARIHSTSVNSDAYLYFFNRKVPANDELAVYGAFHAGEITYAYDNLGFLNRPWEPADHDLAKLMSSYWVNFAATGNPNSSGLPEWPPFSPETGTVMVFDTTSGAMKHPYYDAMEYFYQIAVKAETQ